MRRSIALLALLGLSAALWLGWRKNAPPQEAEAPPIHITKMPVNFATRAFDPAAPPAEMPPLGAGEVAVCDSNFTSSAIVGGRTERTDATHGTVTITKVDATLQLNLTIWLPNGASQRVVDHEQGHRAISEHYYESADQVAERIAETYIGRQVPVEGADLDAATDLLLQKMASDFTTEYGNELNPDTAQQLYDSITDHSRNDMPVKEAISTALQNAEMTAPHPVGN